MRHLKLPAPTKCQEGGPKLGQMLDLLRLGGVRLERPDREEIYNAGESRPAALLAGKGFTSTSTLRNRRAPFLFCCQSHLVGHYVSFPRKKKHVDEGRRHLKQWSWSKITVHPNFKPISGSTQIMHWVPEQGQTIQDMPFHLSTNGSSGRNDCRVAGQGRMRYLGRTWKNKRKTLNLGWSGPAGNPSGARSRASNRGYRTKHLL